MQTADERTRATRPTGRDGGTPPSVAADSPRGISSRAFTGWLLAITAAGLALRWVYVLSARDDADLGRLTDSRWYFVAGRMLAEGWGFGNPLVWITEHHRYVPSAGHPPLYPVFLGAVSFLGLDTPLGARLATCVLGAGAVAVIGLAARELAGARAGLIAAGIAALYPVLWINDGMLLSETPFILFVALFLWSAACTWNRPNLRNVAAMSLWIALAALTRSEAVLFYPLGVLPLLLRVPGLATRARWERVGLAALVAVVVIGPWVAYSNNHRFDHPIFIVSGSGIAMSYGNCDQAYSGTYLGYWYWECGVGEVEGTKDETIIDTAARKQALDYARGHLSEQPKVIAARVGRMFHVYRVQQGLDFDTFFEVRPKWPARLALVTYYPVTLLGILGVVVLWRRKLSVAPYVAVTLTTIIGAALTFGITRYRVGFDVAAVVLAGVALDAIVRRVERRHCGDPRVIDTDQAGSSHSTCSTVDSDGRRRFLFALAAIALGALAIRVWWVLEGYSHYKVAGDALYYHLQGWTLADGKGFINPFDWYERGTVTQLAANPPLYSLFIGAVSRLGVWSVTGHRLASTLLGTGGVVMIGLVGRQIANARTGLIAAAIAAVYANLWINDGMLLPEPMTVLTMPIVLYAAFAFWKRPQISRAIGLGLALGLAALSRGEVIFLAPVLILPLLYGMHTLAIVERVKLLVVTALAMILLVGPWVGYNLTRFEEPVYMTDHWGTVLKAASCDEAWYGEYAGWYWFCQKGQPPGDTSQKDIVLRNEAIEYTRDHAGDLPVVMLEAPRPHVGRLQPAPDDPVQRDVGRPDVGRLGRRVLELLDAPPTRHRRAGDPAATPGSHHAVRRARDRRVDRSGHHLRRPALPGERGARSRDRRRRDHRRYLDPAPPAGRAIGTGRTGATSGTHGRSRRRTRIRPMTTAVTARPKSSRQFVIGLALIALLALAVRLWFVLVQHPDLPLAGDAYFYQLQAKAIASGHGFVDPGRFYLLHVTTPGAAHPPLYGSFLGVLDWVLGSGTVTMHRIESTVLGVVGVVVLGLTGRVVGGERLGLITAFIAAVYANLWINDGVLLSESMVVVVLACVLLASYSYWRRPRPIIAMWLGIALGLGVLTRAEIIFLAPLVGLPLVLRNQAHPMKTRVGHLVIVAAAVTVFTAPWVAYNLTRFEEPTLLTDSTWSVIRQGACDTSFEGPLMGWYGPDCVAKVAIPGDASQRDLVMRDEALDYLGDHTGRIPAVVAVRVARVWDVIWPRQSIQLNGVVEGRTVTASRIAIVQYWLLLPFAIAGVVLLWRRKAPVMPILAPAILVTIAAATTYGVLRYRASAEAGIVLAAAVSIDLLWSSFAARRARSDAGVPGSGPELAAAEPGAEG